MQPPSQSLFRLTVRVLQLLVLSLTYFIPVFICWKCGFRKQHHALVSAFYAGFLRAMNIRVRIIGEPSRYRPLLWVSNHFSYLDVPVLGSVLPVRFTPKSEIATWPVVGLFTKMADSVFIERKASKTLENQKAIVDCFEHNGAISLFPEGTTNDGTTLLPFRSSFFSVAQMQVAGKQVMIQSVSIVYSELEDKPMTKDRLQYLGWYGDMEFFPHFFQLLKQNGSCVELHFHPLVNPTDFTDRKALAEYCKQQVEQGLPLLNLT